MIRRERERKKERDGEREGRGGGGRGGLFEIGRPRSRAWENF